MRTVGKFLLVPALYMSACAIPALAQEQSTEDPFEQTNRAVFEMNMRLDRNVARPVAEFYSAYVPSFMRSGIHNVLQNIEKPVTMANDLLQARFTSAGQTLTRFVANSTLGLGGLFDVATEAGVPDHSNDFGITLGVWGVGDGPYLMLPFIGPGNPRDFVGKVGDIFMDPLTYARFNYDDLTSDLRIGFSIVDKRAQLLETSDQMERTSLDFYATTRSLYRQYRNAQIKGSDPSAPPDDDIAPDDAPADQAPPPPAAPKTDAPPPAAQPAIPQS